MRAFALAAALLTAAASVAAKQIVITVGGNTTNNASTVFQPAEVTANAGDTIFFNFTQGNHTATQSTFASPCIPAHDTNATINGFDSSFRDTNNGTAITSLVVSVTDNTTTIWFFDWNTCAEGGVGGINVNESSTATLAGFRRNAIRLNGTASTTSSASHTATGTGAQSSSTSTSSSTGDSSSDAQRSAVWVGMLVGLPMAVAAALL